MAQQIEEEGEDPRELPLRIALVGAEPYTEETRRRIESMLDLKVYNSFGMSEMNGPGVGIECQEQSGLHIWEDAYILEIIDPETGRTLPDGETGELVMTTLTREGMPLLRYRTHDLTRIIPRGLRLRPQAPPYRPHSRPFRRHVYSQGSKYLPHAD